MQTTRNLGGTHVTGEVLLLGQNNLVGVELGVESGSVLLDSLLVGGNTPQSRSQSANSAIATRKATHGLKIFSAAIPLANGSKLAPSTLTACSKSATAFRSDAGGSSCVPWSLYFAAM